MSMKDITDAVIADRRKLVKTPAGRMAVAMALLCPQCVDEYGNEYIGEPMITPDGFIAILQREENP